MKYVVLIDPYAKQDLIVIFNYVSVNDSFQKADKLLQKLEEMCCKLEKFPHRGHIPPELSDLGIDRFLEIHFKPFRIIYEIIDKTVYVHCILDGRRNMQELLEIRLLR